jgi:hypothetical protein
VIEASYRTAATLEVVNEHAVQRRRNWSKKRPRQLSRSTDAAKKRDTEGQCKGPIHRRKESFNILFIEFFGQEEAAPASGSYAGADPRNRLQLGVELERAREECNGVARKLSAVVTRYTEAAQSRAECDWASRVVFPDGGTI